MDIALVHGNYHGGWCWDLLRPELEGLGHRVFTMDLPISDPSAGAARYAEAVDAALPRDSVPMIVGHSMGGLAVPLVAERRPVRGLVFLAALLPVPGKSANEQRSSEPIDGKVAPTTAEWTDLGSGVWMVGPATATELFFPDASPDVARWAIERLRPQSYGIFDETTPLERWPDVPCHSIVCRDDRALNPDWGRAAARDRLGTVALEIDGGHSPFMTRPAELATLIDVCARA
jgi:pimeloyl-ACP methyl ester carboxylesterase